MKSKYILLGLIFYLYLYNISSSIAIEPYYTTEQIDLIISNPIDGSQIYGRYVNIEIDCTNDNINSIPPLENVTLFINNNVVFFEELIYINDIEDYNYTIPTNTQINQVFTIILDFYYYLHTGDADVLVHDQDSISFQWKGIGTTTTNTTTSSISNIFTSKPFIYSMIIIITLVFILIGVYYYQKSKQLPEYCYSTYMYQEPLYFTDARCRNKYIQIYKQTPEERERGIRYNVQNQYQSNYQPNYQQNIIQRENILTDNNIQPISEIKKEPKLPESKLEIKDDDKLQKLVKLQEILEKKSKEIPSTNINIDNREGL